MNVERASRVNSVVFLSFRLGGGEGNGGREGRGMGGGRGGEWGEGGEGNGGREGRGMGGGRGGEWGEGGEGRGRGWGEGGEGNGGREGREGREGGEGGEGQSCAPMPLGLDDLDNKHCILLYNYIVIIQDNITDMWLLIQKFLLQAKHTNKT